MNPIVLGNLIVDRDLYEVRVSGRSVELSHIEFELLYLLASGTGEVLAKEKIQQHIWGRDLGPDDKRLTVHISRLRKQLRGSYPYIVKTFVKRGYSLKNSLPAEHADSFAAAPGLAASAADQRTANLAS